MTDPDFAHVDPTFEGLTLHGIRQPVYVPPVHPEPIQRARRVSADDSVVPQNARKIALRALRNGWSVRITHAIGYAFDNKTGEAAKNPIKEPTGETTPKRGDPAMKTVGYTQAPPVHSVRVVIQAPDRILVGHWCPGWDFGMVLNGRTPESLVNWTGLEKAMSDAESRQDMRGQERGGWRAEELPLDCDQRPAL